MTRDYENPMDDYWPNAEGREAEQLFKHVNHADVVRIALHFSEYYTPGFTDEQIIGHIMSALGGKANPNTLRNEIRRQRGAV